MSCLGRLRQALTQLRPEEQEVFLLRQNGEMTYEEIAVALEGIPGAIVVTGHADASPAGTRYASNAELSAARARAVARLMTPKLSAPGRLSVEGKGDAELIAPGGTPEDRARNRRVTISIRPNP